MPQESETTRPPQSCLRYESPVELYANIPQIAQLTQQRPRDEEGTLAFLARLRSSTTPEEAVTFTAFAALPKMAIWWGYQCVRTTMTEPRPEDKLLMDLVATWTRSPGDENRYRAIRSALWEPRRSPAVFLALAVGWSGGPIAPHDLAPVPVHRAPRAINSAILSSLATISLRERPGHLARFIDEAVSLFRVH